MQGWSSAMDDKNQPTRPERCPTCNSRQPHLYPAVQHGGEVQICRNEWHSETTIIPHFYHEDGQVLIHWRGKSEGVLVIARSDGMWHCSVKHVGGSYSTNGRDFDPATGLPEEAQNVLRNLL